MTNKEKTNNVLARVTTKIVVSVLFGALAFALAQALQVKNNVDIVVGVGVGVFVSGIAFVIQFLLDVDERVSELGKAAEIIGLVEKSALKTDAVTQLIRRASIIPDTPPLIFKFAQREVDRLSGYLRDLGQTADVTYDGEDRDWLLGLTRAASHTIDATSLTTVDGGRGGFVDGGLWSSDLGHRYLEEQKRAVSRGVKIRRIFILQGTHGHDHSELVSVLKDHQSAGVEVRTLNPAKLGIIQQTLVLDFIVIDGVLSYQSTTVNSTHEQRPRIVATRLVTNLERVETDRERYKELWDNAKPYPDVDGSSDLSTF